MRYLIFILLVATVGCKEQAAEQTTPEMQVGDILFQDLDCGAACDAIESVTEGVDGKDFSHCGIVAQVDGELQVVEAYGSVQAVPIDTFLNRVKTKEGQPKVVIGRLQTQYQQLAKESAEVSKSFIGLPYDEEFKLGDNKYYCSELVYECFKAANDSNAFFPLNVMTFKEPDSDDYMPYWIEYYNKLGVPVPEGDSGINPGAISRNEYLEVISLY